MPQEAVCVHYIHFISNTASRTITTPYRNELTTYRELNEKHLNRLPNHNNRTKTSMNTKRYDSAE